MHNTINITSSLKRVISLLPEKLGSIYTTSVNAATGTPDTAVVIDADRNIKLGQIGGFDENRRKEMLRVRRQDLREYLAQGVPLTFGKHCIAYEEDEDGVTAIFNDGSRSRGSILVAADGASSPIRAQLLHEQHADPASYLPIVGMIDFNSADLEEYQRIATAIVIACTEGLRCMVGLLGSEADRSAAKAYWAVCYKSPTPFEDVEWMKHASKEELYQKAVSTSAAIDPALTKYIRKGGLESIITPPLVFREYWPPMALPEGRVTLIGDALHTMMPFRGAGANSALLDACDLAEHIQNLGSDPARDNVVKALKKFAQIACPRGRDVVSATHVSGDDPHLVLGVEKHLLHN